MDKQDIEFGELPPSKKGRGTRWKDTASVLQSRPGEWAKVASVKKNSAASGIGRLKHFGCDAVQRSNGSGVDIWARWPGDA